MSLPARPDPAARRRVLLGLAHKGAAQLGMDEETRRAAQAAFAGKASLKDFSDRELVAWCWELKRRGADIGIPGPPPKGGLSWDRPTPAQWATIERMAAALGLTDAGLAGFVRRTTGLDDPRFMTRKDAAAVITGLEKWARGRGAALSDDEKAMARAILADIANMLKGKRP